jgi:hypothetical protein
MVWEIGSQTKNRLDQTLGQPSRQSPDANQKNLQQTLEQAQANEQQQQQQPPTK